MPSKTDRHRPEGEVKMPVHKKWSKFTSDNVKKMGKERGAYEIANRDKKTIDIGGSDAKSGVRGRLMSRLREEKPPTAKYFRTEKADTFTRGIDSEASHSDKYQDKHGKKPRYTQRSPRKKQSLF